MSSSDWELPPTPPQPEERVGEIFRGILAVWPPPSGPDCVELKAKKERKTRGFHLILLGGGGRAALCSFICRGVSLGRLSLLFVLLILPIKHGGAAFGGEGGSSGISLSTTTQHQDKTGDYLFKRQLKVGGKFNQAEDDTQKMKRKFGFASVFQEKQRELLGA